MRSALITVVAIVVLLAAGGCGVTVTESFEGKDPAIVWTAMEAVARTPVYEDPDPLWTWEIAENEVWVEPGTRRMEVYRRLVHVQQRPYQKVHRDETTWRFRIELLPGPVADFKARGWEIPAHVWAEGERYFDDVWDILGGRPEAEGEHDSEGTGEHDSAEHDEGAHDEASHDDEDGDGGEQS